MLLLKILNLIDLPKYAGLGMILICLDWLIKGTLQFWETKTQNCKTFHILVKLKIIMTMALLQNSKSLQIKRQRRTKKVNTSSIFMGKLIIPQTKISFLLIKTISNAFCSEKEHKLLLFCKLATHFQYFRVLPLQFPI